MNQLPAHLQKYEARDIGQTLSQNLGTASPPYVSIAGGKFTIIDAAGNEQPGTTFDPQIGVYLDACIIDVGDHISRVFYAKAYDPSAQTFTPPDCWSDNGIGPSISATTPQAPTCNACPNAVWGSAISAMGKQIPACSMVQKIALLLPAYPQSIFLLRVPPNSHKHLRAYVELCRGNGANLANLTTRISFDQTTQGTLLFKAASWIDEATVELRQLAYNEKKTDSLVGRTDVPRPVPAGGHLPAVTHTQPAARQITQQVQQPGPFDGAGVAGNPSTATTQPLSNLGPAQNAQTPSPSDPAPAQRRRRRTAAEMETANGPPAGGQAPVQPATASQAPFPHPGQAAQTGLTGSGQAAGSFGIATGQQAAGNPELKGMLDDFFTKA